MVDAVVTSIIEKGGMKSMIGKNIKRLRTIHQYTQEMLAEELGVSRQVIAKWERGVSQS